MALLASFDTNDLELYIQENTAEHFPRNNFHPHLVTHDNRDAIRQWLRLKGMNERSIATASSTVLANAYRVGEPYIRKVNLEVEQKRGFGGQPIRKRGRGFDLDVDIDFDDKTRDLLTKAFDEADTTGEVRGVTTDLVPPIAQPTQPGGPQIKIDEAAIARAAVGVIGPRIQKALVELTDNVNKEVDRLTHELLLTPESKQAISDVATEATQSLMTRALDLQAEEHAKIVEKLESMIPRRIEVVTKTERRILPAEPRHEIFPDLLETLLLGEHAYLVGEAGTGKTHLFKQVCVAMGYDLETEFFPIDQSLTKYDVKGYKNPLGDYVATAVYKAVKFGGFMAIDEGDMWAAAALGSLNSILANDYGVFGDELVKVHPKFRCALAANTFGFGATPKFIGRNPLDQASLDRFTYIPCHYDESLERLLYGDTPWTTYVHRVRAAVNKLELQHVVSMRAIARGRKFLDNGANPERVCRLALWRNLAPDSIARIENLAGKFGTKLREVA